MCFENYSNEWTYVFVTKKNYFSDIFFESESKVLNYKSLWIEFEILKYMKIFSNILMNESITIQYNNKYFYEWMSEKFNISKDIR